MSSPQTYPTTEARQCCDVGVVIPVYNRATVILPTLDSVARQTVPPARLVVVDDGSTDGSLAAVARWTEATPPPFETLLVRQPNEKVAAARNRGLREVGHLPLVAFLDSDDRWPTDFLERTVAALKADSSAVTATVDRQFIDVHGRIFRTDDCRPLSRDPVPWIFQHGAGMVSATLFRTSAVCSAGGWNAAFDSDEDVVLFVDVALLGRCLHVPGLPVEFHHGNASARNEEVNLSHKYQDTFRRWARTYETVYESLAGRYPEGKLGKLRKSLAVSWYRAGKQLDQLGQAAAARECYKRALHWRPIMFPRLATPIVVAMVCSPLQAVCRVMRVSRKSPTRWREYVGGGIASELAISDLR